MANSLTRLKKIEDKLSLSARPEGMEELLTNSQKEADARNRRRMQYLESGQSDLLKDEYIDNLAAEVQEAKDAVKWMHEHPKAKDPAHRKHPSYWLCSIRGINIASDLRKIKQDITHEPIDNHFDGSHREPEYIEKMIIEGEAYLPKLSVL